MRIAGYTLLGAMVLAFCAGCAEETGIPDDARTASYEQRIRAKWGKPLADLPPVTLTVITANNADIRNEFSWAFALDYALQHGRNVQFVWRDVGGGGSSIEKFLLNVHESGGDPGIDVVWGGGEFPFMSLAKRGLLRPLDLPAETLAQIPETLAGQRLRDAGNLWAGSALSGFGFVYNEGMLRQCRLPVPRQWEDLAAGHYADLLILADPSQSGSAAAAYRMIVLSAPTWPAGWAKLLGILANAKQFTDSAGAAANAPVLGEALVATAIDFYGTMRAAEAPDQIAYHTPAGQSVFTPDPIAICRHPPNAELAQQFVAFVLSARGQALWALPVGAADGPVRRPLARQPIRKDVYKTYAGRMLPWIVNPYRAGAVLQAPPHMQQVDFQVLRELVTVAAVQNAELLRRARRKLAEAGWPAELTARFHALPDDIDALDEMAAAAAALRDPQSRYLTLQRWSAFFRDKYQAILDADID